MKQQPSAEKRFKEKTNDAEMGIIQCGTEENGWVSLAGLCGFVTGLLLVVNTTGHANNIDLSSRGDANGHFVYVTTSIVNRSVGKSEV